ncbi:MAG: hypothetical protein U9Q69_01065 [Nanoarchaeota archaeon]|nr:hypothetical protein [Nanoarchaeota archaeon]
MAFVEAAATELLNPLVNLWNSFVAVFPGLIAALIILIIGYFISLIIGHVVKVIILKARIDKAVMKLKLPSAVGKVRLSSALGELTKWYIFIIFLQEAVEAVNLGTLSIVMTQFVLWLPQLIVAVLTVLVGLFIAHYLSHLLKRESDMKGINFISSMFKGVIIFIAIVIALEQIGIKVDLLQNAFLVLLAAVAFGAALAIGLAFGLGLQKQAGEMFVEFKKRF